MKELLKSKTFWTGVTAVIGAVSGYFTGELEIANALQIGFTGLIGIFLKHGMVK